MYQDIKFECVGPVATITLNRPEAFNALSDTMREELRDVVAILRASTEIQVVILTGAGKAFCAGGDIKLMHARIEEGISFEDRLTTYRRDVVEMVKTLKSIPQITIAKLNGATFGAGCSIAMLCDIRIAADHVKFGLPFGKRGLIPDWGASYFLPRIVGYPTALELSLTGETFDVAKALRINFIHHAAPSEGLDAFVEDYIQTLLLSSPYAAKHGKKLMEDSLSLSLETALEQEAILQSKCYLTDDHREGVACFIEKRKPKFKGK